VPVSQQTERALRQRERGPAKGNLADHRELTDGRSVEQLEQENRKQALCAQRHHAAQGSKQCGG